MIILKWLIIVVLINMLWFATWSSQWNLYTTINDKFFKKVKIKGKLSFLFQAIGGQSVRTHGVIKALLFLQIKGYVLSVGSLVAMIILWHITRNSMLCLGVMGFVMLFR